MARNQKTAQPRVSPIPMFALGLDKLNEQTVKTDSAERDV